MFKKLIVTAAVAAGVVAFVGGDVIGSTWRSARKAVRTHLTASIPLPEQLAEARAQVDAYAEHVIKAEVAAEGLARTIAETEREVRGLAARVERSRATLAEAKERMTVVTASATSTVPGLHGLEPAPRATEEAARQVAVFRQASQALERRSRDLEALRREHAATLASIEQAKTEQARLAQEVSTLAAELTSLEARQAAARTREAVGDATLAANGYALARERLDAIRAAISEKDRLLRYYEVRRGSAAAEGDLSLPSAETPADALAAIEEALASYPAAR